MLLCCEAGNTRVKITFFENDKIIETGFVSSKSPDLARELGQILNNSKILKDVSGCALSCVVPKITDVIYETLKKITGKSVFVVNSRVKTPVKLNSSGIKEIGADRLCNLTGGYILYGTPLLIADFGTATNFDILNKNTEFTGGIIVPGMQMQSDALCSLTAALPFVKIRMPETIIGYDTVSEILSGIVNGHAAMISEMIDACEKELDCKFTTVATGGFANFIAPIVKRKFDFVNPKLTSVGLKELYKLNNPE